MSEQESGDLLGHFQCCVKEVFPTNKCQSSDAMAVYSKIDDEGNEHFDAFCWSCKGSLTKEQFKNTSIAKEEGFVEGEVSEEVKVKIERAKKIKAEPITNSQLSEFMKGLTYKSLNYRGIKDEYRKFYGHLTKIGEDGTVAAQFYPETVRGKLTGYKCRNHPKDFRWGKVGLTGSSCDLSGQALFKGGGKYVVLVGGEEDKLAAFQMLKEYQVSRGYGDTKPIAVVSPTTGENCVKQVKAQYEWFDQYENIIIGLDNDEAGINAAKELCKVLPKEKIKIASWSSKDPNKMLQLNQSKQFIRDFYDAKEYMSTGIIGSKATLELAKEELRKKRIVLPDYMSVLESNMRGGIKQGCVVNIIGDTSVGKTTHVNSMAYHWIFNSPVKLGVVSLEATAGAYSLDLQSIHISKNLMWYQEGEEAIEFMERPENAKKIEELLEDEYGDDRFQILDERDGSLAVLENQMQTLHKKHSCGIVVVDVLTDIIRSIGDDAQADHLMFQKRMTKEGTTIVNVLHTRKPPNTRDGIPQKASEYDALGSGTVVQSGAMNIVINRNKMSKCPIERNTTYVDLTKCRNGLTGPAGEWYFDIETRRCYDRRKYFKEHPEKLPSGYNLDVSSYEKEFYKEGGNLDISKEFFASKVKVC